jgi:hypothetical protein
MLAILLEYIGIIILFYHEFILLCLINKLNFNLGMYALGKI